MIQTGPSRTQISNLSRRFSAFCATLTLLLVVLVVSSLQVSAAPQNAPFAAVVAVAGKPTFARGAAPRAIALRQSLNAGDVVETGQDGKVSILFSDGSQVRLGPGTRLLITEPVPIKGRTSFFRVVAGEVWARLRPGRGVQTQYSSLVVRGTDIHLAVAPDGAATLTVLEGEVQFASDFGEVIVHTSEQSVVRPGAAPTKPVTVANTGLIVEWTLDLNRASLPREKAWTGLAGPALAAEVTRSEAVTRTVNTAASRQHYGDTLFDSRQYQAALAQYNLAAGLAPTDAQVALHRGYALLELGQLQEAAAAFAPATAESQTGAAWVALEREALPEAERLAKLAVAGNGQSAEAHLVLALALMRQPGRAKEAETELRAVLDAQPAATRPQGRAWLAILALSQDDAPTAARESALAVKEAPGSALAHSAAASVAFYSGRTDQALKLANRAADLNPGSTATLLALGQAQLADGKVELAATTAARAVALDPDSAQAYYLLGVADAQRQDYRHAARELQTALRLSPDYFAAAGLLARVYVRMGRPGDADKLLADLTARHPESDTLLAATGETLYAQGKYKEALAQYRSAVKIRPNSALAWNGLARLALDANQLNEAIRAGQRATELAPGVSVYHSTLGLAYSYSGLDRQAEREFRTALAYDPNNALALVRLGLANTDGDARLTGRTLAKSYVQGYMLDPEVSRDFFRGGVKTELAARPTNYGMGAAVANRTVALDGALQAHSTIVDQHDGGPQPNDDTNTRYATTDTTYSPRPGTTLYLHAQNRRDRYELPGTEREPAPDDKGLFQLNEGVFAVKQKINQRATIWAGLLSTQQRTTIDNPNQDNSFAFITGGFAITNNILQQRTYLRGMEPDIRLDYRLGKSSSGPSVFTLGAARSRNTAIERLDLTLPGPPGLPGVPGNVLRTLNNPERTIYTQIAHSFGRGVNLTAQLRQVRHQNTSTIDGQAAGFLFFNSQSQESRSFWLPSLVSNVQLNEKTGLRLLAGRRTSEVLSSIFAPVNTLLTTEPDAVPSGYPEATHGDSIVYELDAEHRFGTGRLLKLYLFQSTGRNIISQFDRYFDPQDITNDANLDNNRLLLNRVRRQGIGARYEHQLGNALFGQVGASYNRSKAQAAFYDSNLNVMVPALFNGGGQAPYTPRLNANVGINYISRSGNKAGVFMNYAGAVFADVDNPLATSRPRFGGNVTFDLQIAREPSVRHQVLLRVNNIFNARQIVYNGVPSGQRRVMLEAVRRF